MRWIGLAAGLALVLAGCGGGSGYQWGAPHGGGKGLPQVRMSASQAVIVPPGRDGELALALRAFVPGPDGWQEAAGAQCSGHRRRLLPGAGGDAGAAGAARPRAGRAGRRAPSASPGPPAVAPRSRRTSPGRPRPTPRRPQRAWWGGGWWYGFQKSGPMRYPDLAVGMR